MNFSKKRNLTLEDSRKAPSGLKRFFSSRRAKYGSVAVLFTVVVLVSAVLFNVLLTAISEHSPLTIDVSSEGFFTLSDASKTLIQGTMPEDAEEIYLRFMMPEDRLKEKPYYNMVMECAKSYREAFSNIKVEFLDIVTRPSDVAEYKKLGLPIDSLSVVVDCPAQKRVKMFGMERCFLTKEGEDSYYAFDGETQFTASIMAVCRATTPVVTFTQGHGEIIPPRLENMFTTAGYTVKRTNLAVEQMDEATDILVISNPRTDFWGISAGEQNEIDIITDYVNDYRDVMVFLSPDAQELPELDKLLESWGVGIERGVSLLDESSSLAGSGGQTLLASYAGDSYLSSGSYSTYGSALHKSLSAQESAPMTFVKSAVPLKRLLENTDGQDGQRSVDTVLTTSPEAYYLDAAGNRVKGTYPLMLLSTAYNYRNDDTVYSHVLVCGSALFTEMVAAGDAVYGNSEIIYTAMTTMSKESAPQGIEIKKLDDNTLAVSEEYAKRALVLSLTVLPGLVFVLGGVVFVRRRHK